MCCHDRYRDRYWAGYWRKTWRQGLVIAAAFPYVIYVLRDILSIEMPVNLVFLLMFCFVLVVLLSLSIAITQLAEKCKRLTQANAILEKRVRDLEEKNR